MGTKNKTIDADTFDELVDALDMLMRKWQRKDESYVRMIAHQGNTKAQARVREWDEEDGILDVPDTFHDGSPITSIKDLSAVMGISEWSAAVYVQDKGARHPLYAEAKAVVNSEFAGTAALMLIPRNAGKFTVDGGVDPKDLHCTLFYAGDIKHLPVKTQDEFIEFARNLQLPIIDASLNGQTVFFNDPEKPVCVLNVDSPQLEAARRKVMDGMDVPQTHGYTPHMTVKYLEPGEDTPSVARQPVQAIFDTLRIAYDGKDVDIPLVPAQTMDTIDVETKGIRRVRTPEGARYFGQPIGSIIVRDVVRLLPTGRDFNPAITEFDVENHGIEVPEEDGWTTKVRFERSSVPELNNRIVITQEKPPVIKGMDPFVRDAGWMSYHPDTGRVEGIQTHERFYRKGVATGMWNLAKKLNEEYGTVAPAHSEIQTADGSAWAATVLDKHATNRDKDGIDWAGTNNFDLKREVVVETDTYRVTTTEDARSSFGLVIEDRVRGRRNSFPVDPTEWKGMTAAARKKRAAAYAETVMPNFVTKGDPYFKYEGRRGFDWTYEDDEEMSDDLENLDDRWKWALLDAEEIGVNWAFEGRENWFDQLDVRAVESVNSVMRQHEEWFPGFTEAVVQKFETKPDYIGGSGNAYASATMANRLAIFPEKEWKSTITLYKSFWEENADRAVVTKRLGVVSSGWSSANVDKISTEHKMDTFTAVVHQTVTHELGHAIINQIGTSEGMEFDPEFMAGLRDILIENKAWDERLGQPLTTAIEKEVSQYGASQPHEMLAEAWSSYVLSSQPTSLVEDIGRYMEDKFTEFMEGRRQ